MRVLEAEPKELNNEHLQELARSLRRYGADLEKRVAGHVTALQRAGRVHESDPVYQSLLFLLRKFTKQLMRAEQELARRDPDMKISVESPGRSHDALV